MSELRQLILYTTLGCSLCEKAKLEIWPLLARFQLKLRELDIAEDPALLERFGARIPLVGLGNPDDTCAWPFDQAQLEAWLSRRMGGAD